MGSAAAGFKRGGCERVQPYPRSRSPHADIYLGPVRCGRSGARRRDLALPHRCSQAVVPRRTVHRTSPRLPVIPWPPPPGRHQGLACRVPMDCGVPRRRGRSTGCRCADHNASGVGRRASGVGRRASGVGRRASGVGRRASGVGRRASGVGRRASGVGRRASGVGRRASGVGRRASGVGRRASGVGRRASGVGRDPTSEVGGGHECCLSTPVSCTRRQARVAGRTQRACRCGNPRPIAFWSATVGSWFHVKPRANRSGQRGIRPTTGAGWAEQGHLQRLPATYAASTVSGTSTAATWSATTCCGV